MCDDAAKLNAVAKEDDKKQRREEADRRYQQKMAEKTAKAVQEMANLPFGRKRVMRRPPATPKRPVARRVPLYLTPTTPEEQEEKKRIAIREEFERKEAEKKEEESRLKEYWLQLGKAVASLKLSDFPKQESIKGKIAARGEDLVSNVRDAMSFIKTHLGDLSKGTVFTDICAISSALLGVHRSSVSLRATRLIDAKAARTAKRRVPKKELYARAAAKLTANEKRLLMEKLQRCWKNQTHVTLKMLLEWAKRRDTLSFPYGVKVLAYALRGMGLCYKMKNHNPIIEERKDLIKLREIYLARRAQLLSQNAYFGFYDETWVYEGMVSDRAWMMKNYDQYRNARLANAEAPIPGPQKGAKRGKRGIVAAVMTEEGILDGTAQIWISGGRASDQLEDYHGDMNADVCEEFMMEKAIPAMVAAAAKAGRPAVLVIDNAPYHNRTVEKPPLKNSKKEVLQQFLTDHGIPFDPKATNKILYAAISSYIDQNGGRTIFKRYRIDEYAKSQGVTILRLPPYHCFFNPIETVWSRGKRHVRAAGTTNDSLLVVRARMLNFLHNFSAEESAKLYDHVAKEEHDIREKLRRKKQDEALKLLEDEEEEEDLAVLVEDEPDDEILSDMHFDHSLLSSSPSTSGPTTSTATGEDAEDEELAEIDWMQLEDDEIVANEVFEFSDDEEF